MPSSGWARVTIALFAAFAALFSFLSAQVELGQQGRFAYLGVAASAAVLVLLAIDRWAWRWPVFRSVLRRPDLNGTWEIELASSHEAAPPKTAYLVIHQTFSTITVEALTDLGRSCSDAASLAKRGPRWFLAYAYRAEPEVLGRKGNEPHRGAAELLVESQPLLRFDGGYWTDRETTGQIRAVGWTRQHCGSFASAERASFEERR